MTRALVIAATLASFPAHAQDTPTPEVRPARRLAVSASGAIESSKLWPGKPHGAFSVGVDMPWLTNNGHALVHTATVGAWFHQGFQHALRIDTALGYRYTFRFGLLFEPLLLGIGYLHTWVPAPAYALVDGRTERVPNRGNPRFLPSASVGVGYDFSQIRRAKRPIPLALSLRYQLAVQTPGVFGTPVFPHTLLELVLRVTLPVELPRRRRAHAPA